MSGRRLLAERMQTLPHGLRLGVLSVLLGIFGALAAGVFLVVLRFATELLLGQGAGALPLTAREALRLQAAPPWSPAPWAVVAVCALGGLATGVLTHLLAPETAGDGTDRAVETFLDRGKTGRTSRRLPLVKMLVSAITIGSGGAAGREGPISHIASSLGGIVADVFSLEPAEKRILYLVGIAAGLSAMFRSPLGTAFFAVEIPFATMAFQIDALPYVLLSSAVSYLLFGSVVGFAPLLPAAVPPFAMAALPAVLVLAVASALLASLIPPLFHAIRVFWERVPAPGYVKPALGGLVVGLIGVGLPSILSGGYGEMEVALRGGLGLGAGLVFLIVLGKLVANPVTIGSGGSGGTFAEILFIGIFFGLGLGIVLSRLGLACPPVLGALVGMAAVASGCMRTPWAALFMTVEISGAYGLLFPLLLAVLVSFFLQSLVTRRFRHPYLNGAQSRAHPERLLP